MPTDKGRAAWVATGRARGGTSAGCFSQQLDQDTGVEASFASLEAVTCAEVCLCLPDPCNGGSAREQPHAGTCPSTCSSRVLVPSCRCSLLSWCPGCFSAAPASPVGAEQSLGVKASAQEPSSLLFSGGMGNRGSSMLVQDGSWLVPRQSDRLALCSRVQWLLICGGHQDGAA